MFYFGQYRFYGSLRAELFGRLHGRMSKDWSDEGFIESDFVGGEEFTISVDEGVYVFKDIVGFLGSVFYVGMEEEFVVKVDSEIFH